MDIAKILPEEARKAPSTFYKPSKLWSTFVLISTHILSLALPLLVLQIYDRILIFKKIETLNVLCFCVILAILCESILRICRSYDLGWAACSFEHGLTSNLLRHILSVGNDEDGIHSKECIQYFSGISKIREIFAGRALSLYVDIPFILFFLFLIAYFAGKLVIIPTTLLLAMSLVGVFSSRKLSRCLKNRSEMDAKRYSALSQYLGNIHVIKSLGFEKSFERLYEKKQFESTEVNYEISEIRAHIFDSSIFFSRLLILGVVLYGAHMVIDRQISMGILIACVILSGRIIHPVQRTLNFFTQYQEALIAAENLKKAFCKKSYYGGNDSSPTCEGRLDVQKLSYKDVSGADVLKDVSFSLGKGDALLLKGNHGDGRELLLDLIAGFKVPQIGQVHIDGIEPHTFPSSELLEHVAYLSSNPIIFRGTIYENLSRFDNISHDSVHEMSNLLGIDEEISKMPAGYETFLDGGKAEVISPGLQQKISLARTLASKPKVILYNEAEHALDKDGYNDLYKLLARLKDRVTFVIMSEDKYVQELANITAYLDEGKLHIEAKKAKDIQTYKEICP